MRQPTTRRAKQAQQILRRMVATTWTARDHRGLRPVRGSRARFLCGERRQRPVAMLVDLLPLVVVVLVQLAIGTGDRLRRLVGLEARVEHALPLGARGIAEALIPEHQVVVRLQILRIDRQHLLELVDRRRDTDASGRARGPTGCGRRGRADTERAASRRWPSASS